MPGAEDGYESDASNTTTAGSCARRAYLIAEGEDGLARRLALGECRPDDGVFAVDSDGVLEDGRNIDIAGIPLGSMEGELLFLRDLDMSNLDFEWAVEDAFCEADVDESMAEEVRSVGEIFIEDNQVASAVAAACDSAEMGMWRERACQLEDEMQWYRDELQWYHDALLKAHSQSYIDMVMSCDGAKNVRCRVEISDPNGGRGSTKLIKLEELLRECVEKRVRRCQSSLQRSACARPSRWPPVRTKPGMLNLVSLCRSGWQSSWRPRTPSLQQEMRSTVN